MIVDPTTGDIVDARQWGHSAVTPHLEPSTLEVLSDRLEEATDAYASALDEEAYAQNDYERAYAIFFIKNTDVPVTIRSKFTDAEVVEAKATYNLAIAKSKRCRAKVAEVSDRLTAAQSHLKWVGANDGGNR